ncbi:MAG: DNA mismatch repair protein MutS [Bacillota bacterium]|nr:DNA mismatch repair protein MutS [Bacillota bacterium]
MGFTPMMQQYFQVKDKCKDCILFFRLGDFYEMFFEDAVLVSKELELVLTGRDCGLEERAPMCGIPFHAANSYIGRLINKGYKVAICEQMEDPALAKGIVKRDIIKVITPGTYTDVNFLEDTKNNYIMSLFINRQSNFIGICFADISTGEFNCTSVEFDKNIIIDEISKYNPSEILIEENDECEISDFISERFNILHTKKESTFFCNEAVENIKKHFSTFDVEYYDISLAYAANGLLNYILETQKLSLSNINIIEYYEAVDYMSIDANSRRNLELTETLRDKTKKGSLLGVLDKTNTAMGARKLRKWLEQPLMNKDRINERLDAVEEIKCNLSYHEDIKEALSKVYDMERIIGRISNKSVNAKELISLKNSIENLPRIKNILSNFKCSYLNYIFKNLDVLEDIYILLKDSIMDNPSLSVKEGNVIKNGFNVTIDELREAKTHGKEWIASLENSEKEVTGIKSLKVGYNKVFGYYIEVTNSNISMIPEGRYIRKQTLSNAERYITPELKEMEEKILGAEEKLQSLEYQLFTEIRDTIEKHILRMKSTANLISELDSISSLASVALENNYCKPKLNNDGLINIKDGRHPVIEKMIPAGNFVSNDTYLDNKNDQLLLITGPNMAGKSTYMRQVALISIMAQIGSFVPAKEADISICDKVFTRIGASDDLSAGKSTFMVEMWEVSNILNNATNDSLILLDEVGRGTSTYDGLSIAWAVIEYILTSDNLKCKTLFATHYHELTSLEGKISGVKNFSVAVKEIGKDIVFLRKIVRGGADQSYGIEVAKLAGLPEKVIIRAKDILKSLENNNKNDHVLKDENKISEAAVTVEEDNVKRNKVSTEIKTKHLKIQETKQVSFTDIQKEELLKDIKLIDVLNLTPMEGFNKLFDIIKRAKNL